MSGCEGVAPSMWHILVRLAYGCREIWGSYAIYVGIPSLILANGWELRHLCPKKAAWCWEKKHLGENSAEDCKKLVIFRDTWRNWPVLNGSWAIYPPHSAFDIDGATQDSERLLWHQSRTFQQKTGPPKWSISFYIALKKWVFQAHRRVPPTTGVVELWKKLFCNENQWNWVVFLKKLMNMFTGDLYSMYVVLQGIGSLPCIRVYIIYVIPFGE